MTTHEGEPTEPRADLAADGPNPRGDGSHSRTTEWRTCDRFLAAWAGGGIAYWLALANGVPKWTGLESGTADALDLYLLVAVLVWSLLGRQPTHPNLGA